MPAKTKLKSEKQLNEALELVKWKLSQKKPCGCAICAVNVTFYVAVRDAILFSLGHKTVRLDGVLRGLKRSQAKATKHHRAHAE